LAVTAFRAHYEGQEFARWNAKFTKWLTNEVKWRTPGRPPPPQLACSDAKAAAQRVLRMTGNLED
jgi:hypothetical protein